MFTLMLKLRPILNTPFLPVAYQNHLSRLKYAAENIATGRNGVFNMSRNFSIKVNIPFNIPVAAKK